MSVSTTTVREVIDRLTYINYRHNRRLDATMPSDWKFIYGAEMVDRMEREYQEEVEDDPRNA